MLDEELLKREDYFGQYGLVKKVIVNKQKGVKNSNSKELFYSGYITYENETEATLAILSLDGHQINNQEIKVRFGTTKYCTFFLNNKTC